MNIKEAYDHWSKNYDPMENSTRDLDQKVTEEKLAKLRFDTVLEIGCGTGKNTLLLSKIAKKVHAIDFSQGMIEKAKEKVKSENVHFAMADITKKWPYQENSIQLIICNLVLEHIENLSPIFAEAHRVLSEKGHFFISELHPFLQYRGIQANFEKEGENIEVPAFLHNTTDFLNAAKENGLLLEEMEEWWHEEDKNKPPRIVSFMFRKLPETRLNI